MIIYDIEDTGVQNYLGQMIEGIHSYGAKATVPLYVLTMTRRRSRPDRNTRWILFPTRLWSN